MYQKNLNLISQMQNILNIDSYLKFEMQIFGIVITLCSKTRILKYCEILKTDCQF